MLYATDIVDVVGPECEMLGPVEDGGTIIAYTEPACYGPMITPELKSGHTVTRPVAVSGARVGDGIAIKIRKVRVLSRASASGTETWVEGRYLGEPYTAKKCPTCNVLWPESYVDGIGEDAIKCKKCNSPINPFHVTCGYTMLFDKDRGVGVIVPKEISESIARQARDFGAIPPKGLTHSVLVLALADMPSGIMTRLRPMVGNLGTNPAVTLPSASNAGDFMPGLVDAPHPMVIKKEDLVKGTDAHMDINEVREGAVVIAPVKVEGGGVLTGDVHAMQGDGEITFHTTDVSAEVTLDVEVIKGLEIDGPILLPNTEDLPHLARVYTEEELAKGREIAEKFGFKLQEEVAPIQVVGSGVDLNEAANNGLERAAKLLKMGIDEVKNRVTITGSVEIGRLPGVVHITMLAPLERLEEAGIAHLVREKYLVE